MAILAVRDAALYLERCVDHLAEQGVEVYLIDNQSTDGTREIAESLLGNAVCQIEDRPFPGYFDAIGILQAKERIAATCKADWFIHHDVDEIRQAPAPFKTLKDAISTVDAAGYTAIDFDEFVFVPISPEEQFENTDYVETMRHYYSFLPRRKHRVNAWKNTGARIDLVKAGGHRVNFAGRRISGLRLILRHYIFLSASHGSAKYRQRVYSKYETEVLGWRPRRQAWGTGELILPPATELQTLTRSSDPLDTSKPRKWHLFSFKAG